MRKEQGYSLITALVLLTMITVAAVYSLEGSNIQSKMIANSLFSTRTYQECRNEQEAQIRFYNEDGGKERNTLLDIAGDPLVDDGNGNLTPPTIVPDSIITKQDNPNAVKSNINTAWSYIQEAPAGRGGFTLGEDTSIKAYLYENDCIASFRFSTNSQTQGAIIEGLKSPYIKI
jgi:hypothetical protein